MKKFYLTMILGLSLCAVLAIAAPKVISPEKVATPAKVAPATVNELAGNYTFAYNDATGQVQKEVKIEVSDQSANQVSVKGMFGDYTITAIYDPKEGTLTFPYQILGQSSVNAEDMAFAYFDYKEPNSQELVPTKDPVVFTYYDTDPFFFANQYNFGVAGVTAEGFSDDNYVVAHMGSLIRIPAEEVHPISIADAIALGNANEGKEAVIDVTGAKVTFVNEDNNTSFMENKSGAISVQSDEALFTQGTELTGTISGMVLPGQYVMADKADVTTEEVDVTLGTEMTVGQACKPKNNFRLATIYIDDNVTVASGNNGITLTSDEYTIEVVDHWELNLDFDDTNLESVTGILIYEDGVMGTNDEPTPQGHMLLCPRSQADIVVAIETSTLGEAINISKTIEQGSTGENARIDVTGVVVNFVTEDGLMTFVENAEGAMVFYWENKEAACPFNEGTELKGYVDVVIRGGQTAKVVGYRFTTKKVDVTTGNTYTVSQANNPANQYRLATFYASDNTQIVVDEEEYGILIIQGEDVMLVSDGLEGNLDLDIDGKIRSVTGILEYYELGTMGDTPSPNVGTVLSPRYQSDIRLLDPLTIGDIKHLNDMESDYVGFTDAKVTFVQGNTAFIEDNTGAVQLKMYGEFDFERGDAIEGQIFGTWNGTTFSVILKKSNIKVTGPADVKYGEQLNFVNDMAKKVDYLVTIKASDDDGATPISWNAELGKLQIGTDGKVFCYDYFHTLSPNYDWANKTYKQITGIVVKVGTDYYVAPRDADDIDASTGIDALGAENEFKAYSIDGIAQPATSVDQLRQGLYIINGKKVIIKK